MIVHRNRIVIVSDCTDVAFSEIRLLILHYLDKYNTDAKIEPIVSVIPFSLIQASFLIRLIASYPIHNFIIFSVVNPIEAEPDRIIGITNSGGITFVGRDNGQFSWLTNDLGCKKVYELNKKEFVPFGGKNVYPEIIAKFLSGDKISEFSVERKSPYVNQLHIPEGTIVHIDNFGLMKLKYSVEWLKELDLMEGDNIKVYLNGEYKVTATFCYRIMSYPDRTWTLYQGSSLYGLPEIGLVREHGASVIGAKIEDIISVVKD